MSRILYLCHRLPYPPDKGCRIRAFHQLRALAERHEVHLLTFAGSPAEAAQAKALREMLAEVEVFPLRRSRALLRTAGSLLSEEPLSLAFFDSRALRTRVREIAVKRPPDVVVAYSSSMAPYAEILPVPRILDFVDADSGKWAQYARYAAPLMRPVYAIEARRLADYEAAAAIRADVVVLATARDAALVRAAAPGARVETVPNGIDVEFFRPLPLPRAERPTLVFTGQMDYFANVDGILWFAREVLPRVRTAVPDVELIVVGRSPTAAVRALADTPGIVVTGTVGDVRPFLARAWVFVAPLRIAQGVQNKVLEALACELPVVCSERVLAGLAEGGFRDGVDLVAAGDAGEQADALIALLGDAERRERLAAAGRRRLLATYSWANHGDRMRHLVAETARGEFHRRPLATGLEERAASA